MTVLLVLSGVLWFLTLFVQGFNLATIMSLVATVMFMARKYNYFAKLGSLITLEVLGLFLTITMQLLFKRFELVEAIIVILLRLAFIGLVVYDSEVYVYVTEERRPDEED